MSDDDHLFTRREFLKSMAVASTGTIMPGFLNQSVGRVMGQDAKKNPIPGFKDDHVLVVVQLSGGNDGLNTVIPYGNDEYYRARPNIAIDQNDLVPLNDYLGFHPAMTGLKSLYDEGKVAVVNGVGYPNPNRSHFRSMKIWQRGGKADDLRGSGWIGRYFDNCCDGQPDPAAVAGIAVDENRPVAFQGQENIGVSLEKPSDFTPVEGSSGSSVRRMKNINQPEGNSADSDIDFIRHTVADMAVTSNRIQKAARMKRNHPAYPDHRFASDLKNVADMIAAGVSTRVYYVALGGFDTHENQLGRHAELCRRFSNGLTAFYRDLEKNNESRRVLVMTFSEFGRRVAENGSAGTDHGTSGPMFLIGDPVKPGVRSKYPGLKNLRNGDLKVNVDFRSVYATVLKDWFSVNPKSVLGKSFQTGDLIGS